MCTLDVVVVALWCVLTAAGVLTAMHADSSRCAAAGVLTVMHADSSRPLSMSRALARRHVEQHPHTLITRFFGLHKIKPQSGRKVRACTCMGPGCPGPAGRLSWTGDVHSARQRSCFASSALQASACPYKRLAYSLAASSNCLVALRAA